MAFAIFATVNAVLWLLSGLLSYLLGDYEGGLSKPALRVTLAGTWTFTAYLLWREAA